MKKRPNGTWRTFLESAAASNTDECIEGGGATRPSILATDGRQWKASRYVWMLAHGDPGTAFVLHACDNFLCVNPGHMYLGDQAMNIQDMVSRGRSAAVELTRHPGEANGRSKLTESDVRAIRVRYHPGPGRKRARRGGPNTIGAIARDFGVGESVVARIVHRQSWRHVA